MVGAKLKTASVPIIIFYPIREKYGYGKLKDG